MMILKRHFGNLKSKHEISQTFVKVISTALCEEDHKSLQSSASATLVGVRVTRESF